MADSKPNRASRKIVTSITGFTLGDSERLSQKKIDKIIDSIREFCESLDEEPDRHLLDSLYVLMESPSMSLSKKMEVLRILRSSEKMNFFADILDTEIQISEGRKKDAFQKILSDRRFGAYARIDSLIERSITSEEQYIVASTYLSSLGVINASIFRKALGQATSRDEVDGIIQNVLKARPSPESVEFLEECYARWKDQDILLDLLENMYAVGDREKFGRYLEELQVDSIEANLLRRVIVLGGKCRNLEISLRAAKRESSLNPESVESALDMAEILAELERFSQSESYYEKAIELGGDRGKVIPKLVSVKAKLKDFEAVVGLTETIKDPAKPILLLRISSLVFLSRFDEARKELLRYQQKFGDDLAYLEMKLDLESTLGDENSAMETANKILEVDKSSQKALDFILQTMYSLGEYDGLIEAYGKSENPSESQKVLYVSASINKGNAEQALGIIRSDPGICLRGQIIDAIFRKFRRDSLISSLESIPLEGEPRIVISRVVGELRGEVDPPDKELEGIVKETGSIALAWILAKYTVLRGNDTSESVRGILSGMKYVSVLTVVEIISSLDSETDLSDVRDSEFLTFPIVTKMIEMKQIESAESLFELSVDPKSEDPFALYTRASIYRAMGNNQQARKFIDRALGQLTNADFLRLSAILAIGEGDVPVILDALKRLGSIHSSSHVPGHEIYEFLQSEAGKDAFDSIFAILKDFEDGSVWVRRIISEGYLRSGDYLNALRMLEPICKSDAAAREDLVKLTSICIRLGQFEKAIEIIVPHGNRMNDSELEYALGDLYYMDNKLNEAIHHYARSMDFGASPSRMGNLVDALISLRRYAEADELVSKVVPNSYLRAKLKTAQLKIGDLKEYIANGDGEDMEFIRGLKHVAETLWKNAEVRESVKEKYDETGDYYIGSITADGFERTGDLRSAIEVRRQLLKDYPSAIGNYSELSRLLELSGNTRDATSVLKKGMKFAVAKEEKTRLVNSAIRLYFDHGMFKEIVSLFESDKGVLNSENLGFIIRSYLERNDFKTAEQLIGQYHGSLIDPSLFGELTEEMDVRKNFFSITTYTANLLDTEFRMGKVLDPPDAVAYAGIPIAMVDQIYNFLDEESYYSDINEQKYELLSREVIQKAVKSNRAKGIPDLRINVIYSCMESPDVMVAKNLYLYIRKVSSSRRKPDTSNSQGNRLLKLAIKNNIRQNPLEIAYFLKLGISDAMDILALMEYVESLNRLGGGV